MASYRTTIFGVLVILGALVSAGKAFFDGDPSTTLDFGVVWAAVMTGLGLIKARDQKAHEDGK